MGGFTRILHSGSPDEFVDEIPTFVADPLPKGTDQNYNRVSTQVAMDAMKPYMLAIIIQVIYTGMFIISKAAFERGLNTFVFVFYSQAAACLLLLPITVLSERRSMRSMSFSLLLKLFLCALIGENTFTINLYNVTLRFTSATLASATGNSRPVITFCLALLLRMETLRLRSSCGIAKVVGISLCLSGVIVIAFYVGPSLGPVNHHHAIHTNHTLEGSAASMNATGTWIKGTFLRIIAEITWSLWIILQAMLLKKFPNRMLVTFTQCLFSTIQSFVVALVAERDISRWKLRPDIGLLATMYTGFVVTGVSYYLQVWCVEMKGPVFLAAWTPLSFVFTILCFSLFLGETIQLGRIVGGILLVGGLYSMLWGKSKEIAPSKSEVTAHEDNAAGEKEFKKPEDSEVGEQQEVTSTLSVVEQV
ncbi:hypothetical protein ACP4OV_012483 [Aristida adscensionis]